MWIDRCGPDRPRSELSEYGQIVFKQIVDGQIDKHRFVRKREQLLGRIIWTDSEFGLGDRNGDPLKRGGKKMKTRKKMTGS